MKKRARVAAILFVWVLICSSLLLSCGEKPGDVTKRLTDLGIPLSAVYTDEDRAQRLSRRAEDMVVYDGRLYVGCGNYDANTGPVNVWHYDAASGEWKASDEVLEDEQIKRFVILDGTLCIPGTDPRGDWTMGNYYTLSDDSWLTHRTLPSGIHCFDGVIFDGKTFFALGVNTGDYPVVVSEGDGFTAVPFTRDGEVLDTSTSEFVRVHNLSVFDGRLFAFLTLGNTDALTYDVYCYDGASFCYFSTPPEVFLRSYDLTHSVEMGNLNTLINNHCYFITEDMVEFRPYRVGDSDLVSDMQQIGDTLYVLGYRQTSDGYESAVYATRDGKQFDKLFWFSGKIPAGAFAYGEGSFYFSMGRYYDADANDLGRVYALPYSLP